MDVQGNRFRDRVHRFWEEHNAEVSGATPNGRTLEHSLVLEFGQQPAMFAASNRFSIAAGWGDACLPEPGTEEYEILDMFVREAEALAAEYNVEHDGALGMIAAGRRADGVLNGRWINPVSALDRIEDRSWLKRFEERTRGVAAQDAC